MVSVEEIRKLLEEYKPVDKLSPSEVEKVRELLPKLDAMYKWTIRIAVGVPILLALWQLLDRLPK